MSKFSGVTRIIGVVMWRVPRLVALIVRTKSTVGSGQRRAAESFRKTLLAEGVPSQLAAELAKEYPKFELRDLVGSISRNRQGDNRSPE